MNKRILELIKQMDQAGLPYGDNAMTVTESDLEYFAELIVRECANISNQAEQQCQHPATQILKHFGVEE